MKVENKWGVPNQFVLQYDSSEVFQSYSSIICIRKGREIFLDKNKWDYSRTTIKYLCKFLGVWKKKDIEKNLKDGVYKLTELNS